MAETEWKKCDCLQKVQKDLKEHFEKEAASGNLKIKKIETARFKNQGLILDGSGWKLYNDFEVTGTYQTKKGDTKQATEKVSVTHSYCCFCGNPLTDPNKKKEVASEEESTGS